MTGLLDAYQFLQQGAEALSLVERNGIRIDVEYCKQKIEELDERLSRSERRLARSELAAAWRKKFGDKTSWTSGQQLRAVLYTSMGVKPFKTTEKGDDGSIDEESLRSLDVDGIEHLLRSRSDKKCRDVLAGFLKYQVGGFLYPNFLLHTVQTYRGSSADPNMQNVPHRDPEQMAICRRAIIPRDGRRLLEIDFKAVEVAGAATYHKDPRMLEYLRDPSSDMHADMAHELFVLPRYNQRPDGFSTLRSASKNGFVFPQFYGDYYVACAGGLAYSWCKLPRSGRWRAGQGVTFNGGTIGDHLLSKGINSMDAYTEHVKNVEHKFWNERFRVYNQWRKDWYAEYQRTGEFAMHTGFRCAGLMTRNQAINYPVQGVAFHILLRTLAKAVAAMRGWSSLMIGQVHDSMLIDADDEELPDVLGTVRRIATQEVPAEWRWINVPLAVEASRSEVDGSWGVMTDEGKWNG